MSRASLELIHDLNNPLAVVIGYAALVVEEARLLSYSDEQVGGKLLDYSVMLEKAAEYCHHLSQHWRHPARTKLQNINLVQVARDVHSCLFFGNTAIVIQSKGPNEIWVRGSQFDLMRLLQNLLRNSIESGAARVLVTITRKRNDVYLVIADNGCGMPRKKVELAVTGEYSRTAQRIGLNLTICRHLAKMHKAAFTVLAVQGKGTTVRVVFPSTEKVGR